MIFHSPVVSSLLRWSFMVAHSELGFDGIFGQWKINWKISVSASVSEAPCSVASEKLNAKAGLSFSLFLIPSVVSSNTACLPLQRPCDFEDMLLFSHKLQESKSMASSGLKTYKDHREAQCQDCQERKQAPLQLSQPRPRQQVCTAAGPYGSRLLQAAGDTTS